MRPSSEDHSLADSAYELISSTDGESQDGRGTESVADSLDIYPQADDVQSLGSPDNDDDESSSVSSSESGAKSEHLEHDSKADSIRYAEEALGSPSAQLPSTPDYDYLSDNPTPLFQSIEFNEADVPACLGKISVKHTIRDFSEAETAAIAEKMHMRDPPKRLVAAIRQTMSHHCLSTREPLRVLYVGSEAGRGDITYKISTALLASAPDRAGTGDGSDSEGVYNIVPISSFGSSKVPEMDEIQLMGVSAYYIKVERCTSAEETVYEGESFPSDTVYSITVDNDKTYKSVFSPSGSVVQPKWALPHIAIFFVSANDDEKAEKTRDAAWEFMTRHAVPSIFISHSQSFYKSGSGRWRDFVDQAAVHLCLESRDPERPIPAERLPIDLVSFLNIDARQMNRNLAYLTGLYEPLVSADAADNGDKAEAEAEGLSEDHLAGLLPPYIPRSLEEAAAILQSTNWKPVLFGIVTTLLWVYLGTFLPGFFTATKKAAVSTMPSVSVLSVASTVTSACSVPTVTPTITISLTSTKTVKLGSDEATDTATNFGVLLSDKPQPYTPEPEAKKVACSIEMYSNHEILVKVPSGAKTKWLAKGAIDIDVWRGQELLKSKLSATDDGIIIELNKKDAYGVMNVSVVTTRRPKINETFAVDFGKPTAVAQLFKAGSALLRDAAKTVTGFSGEAAKFVEDSYMSTLTSTAQKIRDGAASVSLAQGELINQAKNSVTETVNKALKGAQEEIGRVAERFPQADYLRDGVQLSILRAQITSKLWWLRVQGRMDEHADYMEKATRFVKNQERIARDKRMGTPKGAKPTWKDTWGRSPRSCKGAYKCKWNIMG